MAFDGGSADARLRCWVNEFTEEATPISLVSLKMAGQRTCGQELQGCSVLWRETNRKERRRDTGRFEGKWGRENAERTESKGEEDSVGVAGHMRPREKGKRE